LTHHPIRLSLLHSGTAPRKTRRALLAQLGHVGVLAAGLELAAACDRLPGQARHVPRIGWVPIQSPTGDPAVAGLTQALVSGLGDYGYIPGQNIQFESRFPTDASQNSGMVSDLLASGVDILVTGGTAATLAAKQATSTVPVVGIYVGDPVQTGLVQSIAKPGGNVTAIANGLQETAGKLVELLRLIVPTLRRPGYIYNPANVGHIALFQQFSALAAASGLEAVPAQALTMTDLDGAFQLLVSGGVDALYYPSYQGTEGDRHVAALALAHHLVNMGADFQYPQAGGLLSYGTNAPAVYRRGGYFVDRILKGAKPADLPVEFPTTFDLVVNQATVTALGITIPDEVAQQVTSWI